jgi:hypothetical protein
MPCLLKTLCLTIVAFLISSRCLVAQSPSMQVSGKVINSTDQSPLVNASVYLNSTTIGTTTSEQGTFTLNGIPPGRYELVVSYLGFKTVAITVDEKSSTQVLSIALEIDATLLKGVEIKATPQNPSYLAMFKRYFIGINENAAKCRILNPEVLTFDYDEQAGLLTAHADKPLEISNEALGYLLHYDLQYFHFYVYESHLIHFGYPRFENLPTKNKRKQRNWEQNRIETYLGSKRHFLKALARQQLKEEGFEVNKLIKVENRDTARAILLRLSDNTTTQLPKVVNSNIVFSQPLPYDSIIEPPTSDNPGYVRLVFNHSLFITPFFYTNPYKKTAADKKSSSVTIYLGQTEFKYPPSILTMTTPEVYISRNGLLTDPVAISTEGGWADKQIADLLPLDYELPVKTE